MADETITISGSEVEEEKETEEDSFMIDRIKPSKDLSNGIIELYQKDLTPIQEHVKELTRNQDVLRDITQNEITQINDSIMIADISSTFDKMKVYHKKLVGMKKDMNSLTTRIEKFKLRAQKLQLQKEREELDAAREKEKQRKYEKQLTAKTAASPSASPSSSR